MATNAAATLTVRLDETHGTITPLLHGHFAEHLGRCCNDGLWVGADSAIPNVAGIRKDVVDALARIGIPQLRWPGGCYADSYHWRDGIGPAESRPRTLGESCGARVVEDNRLGTHEFIALCRAIGAEPYLAGNMGSGSVQEMCDWLHYCNLDARRFDTTLVRERAANGHPEPMNVRYWGVGNENWACGGNYDAADYAKEFRRYATFLKQTDPSAELVACGDNYGNRDWNPALCEVLKDDWQFFDHLSLHRYWAAGPAVGFGEDDHFRSLLGPGQVETDILRAYELLVYYARGRRVPGIAFDEWGVWHPEATGSTGYEAPSTLRDALAAAATLDIFHRHADKVSMANLAQIVNVLHTLIQTAGDAMWLTPTYHVFGLYAAHRGATSLRAEWTDCPTREIAAAAPGHPWQTGSVSRPGSVALGSASVSRREGEVAVSLSNRSLTEPLEMTVGLSAVGGATIRGAVSVGLLTAPAADAHNGADATDAVSVVPGDAPVIEGGGRVRVVLPPCSVQTLRLTLE